MNDYFYIPVLNGLFFYYPGSTQYLYNRSFVEEAEFLVGFTQKGYCQKVSLSEGRKVQFQSNYDVHQAELLDIDDNVITTLLINPVFTPIDGNYIQYEFLVPFNAEGYFRVRLTGSGSGGDVYAISEWVVVQETFDNTFVLEFSNSENDELLYFDGGFTARLQVEAHLYKRNPQAEITYFRGSDGRGRNLSSRTQRRYVFETKDLPHYIHEQLAIGCSLDRIQIDGSFYSSEEGYEGPDYTSNLYMLANGTVILEHRNGFGAPANFNPKSPATPGETFNIIDENSDPLITENGDNLVWRI